MWICTRCQAENRDALSACESCGAPRTAGRFGSAPTMGETTARPPRVTAPVASQTAREPVPRPAAPAARRSYAQPEMPPRGPLSRLARVVGALLLLLLPLLCAALCVRNQSALRAALPRILPENVSGLVQDICFWALVLVAVLVSMLPGLWTMLLAGPGRKRRGRKAA